MTAPLINYRALAIAGLVFAALAGGPTPAARADNIDDHLIDSAKEMVTALQAKGLHNVGVLKFLVKKGKGPTDGNAGPLNMNMAERVERALIHGFDEARPLGVIHNATEVAAKADPHFSVRSADARKKLFAQKYPLAWGTDRVSPDAFLTGTVDLSPDMRKVTVEIGYFDKTGAIHDLKKLEMRSDRSILADSGQSFAIPGRSLKKKRSLAELDDDAANSAANADKGTPVDQQLGKDSETAPIKFEVRFNDAPQDVRPDENSTGELRIATPQKNDRVSFVLTNTTQEKIGVVIKVNGVSILENETAEDPGCMKWVLEPGKTYTLRGFYAQGKVDLFKVLDDEESAARMADWGGSRPRAGYIDVSVFREDPNGEEMKVGRTLRSLSARGGKGPKPATAGQARSLVEKQVTGAPAKRKSRGLIVEGGGSEGQTLDRDDLKNPAQIYQMQIGYYKSGSP